MLGLVLLNVIMPSVVMFSVVAPPKSELYLILILIYLLTFVQFSFKALSSFVNVSLQVKLNSKLNIQFSLANALFQTDSVTSSYNDRSRNPH